MSAVSTFRNTALALLRVKASPSLARFHPSRITFRSASSTAPTRKHPQNDDIPYRVVQLVDPETGRLNPPVELRDILSQLDLREYSVELVSAGPTPIVKVINKRETYEKNKERKARARQQMEQKEIQLTWGIASQDLTHKLKKVRAVLERGGRVDLVYAPRKGQPLPTKEGMHARVEETMDILTDVGKEWKPREIKKAVTALYLQGKTKQS